MVLSGKHNRNDCLGQSLFTAAGALGPSLSHGGGRRAPFLFEALVGCQGRGLPQVVQPDFGDLPRSGSPYVSRTEQGVERCRRTGEHKILPSTKSLMCNARQAVLTWRERGVL
jgi:hypothetical protein